MAKSTTINAVDQHAATTMAAVWPASQSVPALHPLRSAVTTILRCVERLRRRGPVPCGDEAGPAGSSCRAP